MRACLRHPNFDANPRRSPPQLPSKPQSTLSVPRASRARLSRLSPAAPNNNWLATEPQGSVGAPWVRMEGWGSAVQMEGGLRARPAEKDDHCISVPDWSEESNAPGCFHGRRSITMACANDM